MAENIQDMNLRLSESEDEAEDVPDGLIWVGPFCRCQDQWAIWLDCVVQVNTNSLLPKLLIIFNLWVVNRWTSSMSRSGTGGSG